MKTSSDKTIKDSLLIIGGCGGIGRAVVAQAMKSNTPCIIMDLPGSLATMTDFSSPLIPIDLRDSSTIQTAFAKLDTYNITLSGVVFASGYTADLMPITALKEETLQDVLGGNLTGQALAARECAIRCKTAAFVFVTTAIGQVGAPGYGPYAMAKSGMNALIRVLAAELAPKINVNGVAPGPVDTPFIRGGLGRGVKNYDPNDSTAPSRFDRKAFEARTPMGRLATPEDIAAPILFLLSGDANFITGQVLHINGGAFMRD